MAQVLATKGLIAVGLQQRLNKLQMLASSSTTRTLNLLLLYSFVSSVLVLVVRFVTYTEGGSASVARPSRPLPSVRPSVRYVVPYPYPVGSSVRTVRYGRYGTDVTGTGNRTVRPYVRPVRRTVRVGRSRAVGVRTGRVPTTGRTTGRRTRVPPSDYGVRRSTVTTYT